MYFNSIYLRVLNPVAVLYSCVNQSGDIGSCPGLVSASPVLFRTSASWLFYFCSLAVWLHHHLCGSVPSGSALRSAQQLGRGAPGRPQVCVRVPQARGRARSEDWRVVHHPGGSVSPVRHCQCELSIRAYLPVCLSVYLSIPSLSSLLLVTRSFTGIYFLTEHGLQLK